MKKKKPEFVSVRNGLIKELQEMIDKQKKELERVNTDNVSLFNENNNLRTAATQRKIYATDLEKTNEGLKTELERVYKVHFETLNRLFFKK